MGKLSSTFTILLMFNIIGFILMSAALEEGFAASNPFVDQDSLLVSLYSPVSFTDSQGTHTVYFSGNNSQLYGAIPQQPPTSFIENVGQFIDRIFVLFAPLRILIGILVFPIALITYLGIIPWQISQLVLVPLFTIYLLGFLDLLSGGDN